MRLVRSTQHKSVGAHLHVHVTPSSDKKITQAQKVFWITSNLNLISLCTSIGHEFLPLTIMTKQYSIDTERPAGSRQEYERHLLTQTGTRMNKVYHCRTQRKQGWVEELPFLSAAGKVQYNYYHFLSNIAQHQTDSQLPCSPSGKKKRSFTLDYLSADQQLSVVGREALRSPSQRQCPLSPEQKDRSAAASSKK